MSCCVRDSALLSFVHCWSSFVSHKQGTCVQLAGDVLALWKRSWAWDQIFRFSLGHWGIKATELLLGSSFRKLLVGLSLSLWSDVPQRFAVNTCPNIPKATNQHRDTKRNQWGKCFQKSEVFFGISSWISQSNNFVYGSACMCLNFSIKVMCKITVVRSW